jgi:hypothetical protein
MTTDLGGLLEIYYFQLYLARNGSEIVNTLGTSHDLMAAVSEIPAWLGTAILGAVLAALIRAVNIMLEWYTSHLNHIKARNAALVDLHSLLVVSRKCCNFVTTLYPIIITPRPSIDTFCP